MQISFEVVLEIHSGPVDQRVVVFLLKLTEVENVVGFRTVEIKITCVNRVFVHLYLIVCLFTWIKQPS